MSRILEEAVYAGYRGVYEGFCLLETATRRLGELQELIRRAYE